MFSFLKENEIARNLFSSALMIVLIVVSRLFAVRSVRAHRSLSTEAKRQWLVFIRNTSLILILTSAVVVWASELRTFALSIAAIAVAIVLATKELIVSVLGGFFRTSAKLFKVGDRIRVGEFRGDVIDMDFMSTTLYEVGPGSSNHQYTGHSVRIPNSYFLDKPLVNETPAQYSLHTFQIPVPASAAIEIMEKELLSIATEVCSSYLERAILEIRGYAEREAITKPSVEPKVSLLVVDQATILLIVRVPVPELKSGSIEQKILKKFLVSDVYRSEVQRRLP